MTMFANLGPTLILLRELRGMSQSRVAREAMIGKNQLSLYETGRRLPQLDTLESILSALSIGQLDLFSTLELVDRRAADLEQPGAGQPRFRSDLLSQQITQGFNGLMAGLDSLHRLVLSEEVRSSLERREADRGATQEQDDETEEPAETPSI
jgi:transcriptional regulator with XRE-family HTH domain